jgi:hypothetical protein
MIISVIAELIKPDRKGDLVVIFLITWYMLWKLFHDKNKD